MATERILIIDDSPIDARFASKILTEAGFNTTIVHDSEEALGVARQLNPDLILLDVTMPKIDGYQVCQQLKGDPQTRGISTVLYTIRDQFIDCLKGIEAGADDFIIKTLSASDFLNRVKRILTERELGFTKPLDKLDLQVIQSLAEMEDRVELFQLLHRSFTKHVREAMSVLLGSHVTGVLLERALEKAAIRFPSFSSIDMARATGLFPDAVVFEEVTALELIEWFQNFCDELYHLVVKLTRSRVNGPKEARGITSGFNEMILELQGAGQQRRGTATAAPADADVAEAEEETGRSVDTALRPAPARQLSPDCTFDSSGNLIYCNEDLMRVLGYGKNELMGRPFSSLLTVKGRRVLSRALDRLVDQGTGQAELSLRAKDGTLLHAEARLTALYDSQGYFAMTRCGLQLIPESMLIQERDEEIEKLKRSLQELQDEFSTLASTISHDVRQPLHAILLLCQFLQDEFKGKLDPQAVEYIQSIEQAGSRLKQMVEDLVHYARTTRDESAYEKVNLNQLVDEVHEELSNTLAERVASLQVLGELPTLICNREQIKELLSRLVSNGIKFNDEAQPLVEIGMAKEDEDGYTLYVKDNGIGIEESYHESIFRLFHRLHTPEEYEGTGAGLAICRRIMDAHGGRIWVRSAPGAGTTFFFKLPRQRPLE